MQHGDSCCVVVGRLVDMRVVCGMDLVAPLWPWATAVYDAWWLRKSVHTHTHMDTEPPQPEPLLRWSSRTIGITAAVAAVMYMLWLGVGAAAVKRYWTQHPGESHWTWWMILFDASGVILWLSAFCLIEMRHEAARRETNAVVPVYHAPPFRVVEIPGVPPDPEAHINLR